MERRRNAVAVMLVGTFAALLASACGAPARPASSPPMQGSAEIRPSPARAERVPVGPVTPPTPAPSSSAS